MNKLRLFWPQLFQEPKIYSPVLASLFLNILMWFLIIWRLPISAVWIPLHYNSYFGIDWIGPWYKIIYYPAVSLLMVVLNLVLLALITKIDRRIAYLLNWAGVLVQLIVLTALVFLIINYFG